MTQELDVFRLFCEQVRRANVLYLQDLGVIPYSWDPDCGVAPDTIPAEHWHAFEELEQLVCGDSNAQDPTPSEGTPR